MHGLFTYNHAAHAILKEIGGSNPANLRVISARFSAPVRLGDVLVTKIWRLGTFQGEFEDVRFTTLLNGRAVLNNGMALVRPHSTRGSKV
jgi:peroxisomal enoyl-CoA hydratase 2